MTRLSVIMPVYNDEEFLSQAIESILQQSYSDYEFIIINDGSTDRSGEIIHSFAQQDDRILVMTNSQNIGVTKSANMGIGMASGEYIARMDADDISLPDRFEKQIEFLDRHKDVWVLGGQIELVNEKGESCGSIDCSTDEKVLRWMAVSNGAIVFHPTTMFRKEKINLVGNYPEDCRLAQDSALWRELYMVENFPLQNLGEVVLAYRIHNNNISRVYRKEQVETVIKYQALFYESMLDEKVPLKYIETINFPSRTRYTPLEAIGSIQLLERLFTNFRYAFSLNHSQLNTIKRDVSRKIFAIGYRYPFHAARYNFYAVLLYPPQLLEFVRIYCTWLLEKINRISVRLSKNRK